MNNVQIAFTRINGNLPTVSCCKSEFISAIQFVCNKFRHRMIDGKRPSQKRLGVVPQLMLPCSSRMTFHCINEQLFLIVLGKT